MSHLKPAWTCKIELPTSQTADADEQYGGTRTLNSAYVFHADKQIGEGTYGQVFQGFERNTDQKVALKRIRMETEREGFPITAIREIKLLSALKCKYVVNLREIVRSDISKMNNFKGSIYMAFDYADYDLTGFMESAKYNFTEAQIKCIMKQLLMGLQYCHSNNVLHRDVKASNILIDSKGIVKLADFGLARSFQDNSDGKFTNRVITLWYRPPELLMGADMYGPEVDMWSAGCIFAELLSGKPIFPGKDELDQLDKIFQILGTPSETTWPGVSKLEYFKDIPPNKYARNKLRDWVRSVTAHKRATAGPVSELAIEFLASFLTLDPTKRINALDATVHKYFYEDPVPCEPHELPCKGSSHEYTMKKRRNETKDREQAGAEGAASHASTAAPAGGYPSGQAGAGTGPSGGWHQDNSKRQRPGGPPPGNPPRAPWTSNPTHPPAKYPGPQGRDSGPPGPSGSGPGNYPPGGPNRQGGNYSSGPRPNNAPRLPGPSGPVPSNYSGGTHASGSGHSMPQAHARGGGQGDAHRYGGSGGSYGSGGNAYGGSGSGSGYGGPHTQNSNNNNTYNSGNRGMGPPHYGPSGGQQNRGGPPNYGGGGGSKGGSGWGGGSGPKDGSTGGSGGGAAGGGQSTASQGKDQSYKR